MNLSVHPASGERGNEYHHLALTFAQQLLLHLYILISGDLPQHHQRVAPDTSSPAMTTIHTELFHHSQVEVKSVPCHDKLHCKSRTTIVLQGQDDKI